MTNNMTNSDIWQKKCPDSRILRLAIGNELSIMDYDDVISLARNILSGNLQRYRSKIKLENKDDTPVQWSERLIVL